MALDIYIRGLDSIELEFTLLDEDGVAINTGDLDDVKVELMTTRKATPENTVYWTGTILTGEVIQTDATAGKITCYIDKTETADWPLKTYYARVTKTETDANFGLGHKYSVSVEAVFRLNVE